MKKNTTFLTAELKAVFESPENFISILFAASLSTPILLSILSCSQCFVSKVMNNNHQLFYICIPSNYYWIDL